MHHSDSGSPPSVHTTGTFSSDSPRRSPPKPLNPTAIAFESRGNASTPPPPLPTGQDVTSSGSWSVQPTQARSDATTQLTPSQMEREFQLARALLPHVARPALVAVLASILDDFPTLAPVVRHRCDRAMAAVVAQQQHVVQHPQSGSCTPQLHSYGGGDVSPQCGSVTPPGQLRQRASRGGTAMGRHTRDDDMQEYCAVHGNMRPLKHLVYRPSQGNYECVHGFHCLESSTPSSLSTTPVKDMTKPTTSSVGPAPLGQGHNESQNRPFWSQPARPPNDADADIDVEKLQSLLRNVRAVQQSL